MAAQLREQIARKREVRLLKVQGDPVDHFCRIHHKCVHCRHAWTIVLSVSGHRFHVLVEHQGYQMDKGLSSTRQNAVVDAAKEWLSSHGIAVVLLYHENPMVWVSSHNATSKNLVGH